jgi:hypothetical protein
MPQDIDGSPDSVDHGDDILELALQGIVDRISALAPATTVQGIETKARFEQGSNGIPTRRVVPGTVDKD